MISIDSAPENVAEKLIKLVALSRESDAQGEVENALAAAYKLAAKHNIDLATVDVDSAGISKDSTEEFVTEMFKTASGKLRRPPAHKYISDILVSFFRVRVIMRCVFNGKSVVPGSTIDFVGRKSDVTFAKYAYGFLHHTFTRLWRKYKNENDASMSERNSFYNGLWLGLRKKLSETQGEVAAEALETLQESGTGDNSGRSYEIVVMKEKEKLSQAVEGFHPVLETVSVSYDSNVRYDDTFYSGFDVGSSIAINRPLSEESEKPKSQRVESLK